MVSSQMVPVGRLQVATPRSMALSIRTATEAQTAVDERVAPLVPPLVANALAADGTLGPTIAGLAATAVTTNIAGRNLVLSTDGRMLVPIQQTESVIDKQDRVGELALVAGRLTAVGLAHIARRIPETFLRRPVPYTVGAGGAYSTIPAANTAFGAMADAFWSEGRIVAGEYDVLNVYLAERAVLSAAGLVTVRCLNADNASDEDVNHGSPIWQNRTSVLRGLRVETKNARYAIHSDDNRFNRDQVIDTEDCVFVHYGNEDAVAWRTANPGSGLAPGVVMIQQPAWGMGSAPGNIVRHKRTTFIANYRPYYWHTNGGSTRLPYDVPTRVEMDDCTLISRKSSQIMELNPLGTGQRDTLTVRNSHWVGGSYIRLADTPWRGAAPYVADHAEMSITFSGCDPVTVLAQYGSRALRLRTSGTSITVTGALADKLFGAVTTRPGGGGLGAYAFGSLDISAMAIEGPTTDDWWVSVAAPNTIGGRLGVLSAASSMVVTTSAGSVTVTIPSGDYTATGNAQLATINTQLGAIATADLYDVSHGEHYLSQPDREQVAYNVGTAGIPRFSAVRAVYRTTSPGDTGVELIPTTAGTAEFVGITLERILPGKSGRILWDGMLRNDDIGTAVMNRGQAVYLSDTTAGALSLTGTRQIGVGADAQVGQFRFTGRRIA